MAVRVCPVCGRQEADASARFCDVDGAALVQRPPAAGAARANPPGGGARGWGANALLASAGAGMLLLAVWIFSDLGELAPAGDIAVEVGLSAPTPKPLPADVPGLLRRCYGPVTPGLPRRAGQPAEDAFERAKAAVRLGVGVGAQVRPVTLDEEREVADELEQALLNKERRSSDRAATGRLDRLSGRLTPLAPRRSELDYRFLLLASPQVNAMMGPGGRSFFYEGLLDAMQDEHLSFVLGHELSHSELKHVADKLSVAMAGRELGEAVFGKEGKQAGEAAGSLAMALLGATYDQDQEFEADRLGLCFTWIAGGRADAGVGAMNDLERASDGRERAPGTGAKRVAYDILTSHPPTAERRAYLLQLADVIDREGSR